MEIKTKKKAPPKSGTYMGKSANGKPVVIMQYETHDISKGKKVSSSKKATAKKPASSSSAAKKPATGKSETVKGSSLSTKLATTRKSSAPTKKVNKTDKTTVQRKAPQTVINPDGTRTTRGSVSVKRVQTSKKDGVRTTITEKVTREEILITPCKTPVTRKRTSTGKAGNAAKRKKVIDI